MVSVHSPPTSQLAAAGHDVDDWLGHLAQRFSADEVSLIRHACTLVKPLYANRLQATGVPTIQHVLGLANILIEMNMDVDSIVAGILCEVPECVIDWHELIAAQFGVMIVGLVEGVSRMHQIQQFTVVEGLHDPERKAHDHAQQIESLRKMLLAMVEDMRVVLIKLAERTQTLRGLSSASPVLQKHVAQECQGIFAPLANRLGVWQLKWELEDLSLRYLEPALYKEVAKMLDERRVDREQYIIDVVAQLKLELAQAGIKGEVTGRPKHIFSIVKKMRSKHLDFDQLYDVRAVRILVDDVKDCYTALGLIHSLWQPIPNEFDDYIARPKSNDYRSLHTAVSGPRGLALEVQIRTFEMHQHSELGVAAHWRYKEGGKSDPKFDEKIAWLRQILAWKEEVADTGHLLEQFNSALFQDKVYVLTPQGKVIDLPAGATPVDFAYALHTDLGHRTRGAKVNGNIVPLNTKLQNGQRVEILTAKHGAPSRDWLNASLGYLQSASARAKVRHWFKYQHFEEHVALGRTKLDRELHRAGVGAINQEKIAQKLHFQKLEDFLAAIGRGDVTEHQIALAVQEEVAPGADIPPKVMGARANINPSTQTGVVVEGVGNLQTSMAKCCKPMPPDTIVGYLTRDHGVTIHRNTCAFITRVPEDRQNRILEAHWGQHQVSRIEVGIEVEAHDRHGLLRDISDLFYREKVNATQANTVTRNHFAHMQFMLQINHREQLSRLMVLIGRIPSVVAVRRRI